MRLSIDEYASRFNLPISTVHTQLRNKELEYSIDNGMVYILLRSVTPQNNTKSSAQTIINLYQQENQELKEKLTELEQKIDKLINDKEQMLRDERSRIENLYQSKDEQLKSVLELIHTKLQLTQVTAPQPTSHSTEEVVETLIDVERDETHTKPSTQKISLRHYLKNIGLEAEERRIIKRRFAGAYGSDVRILQHNGEFFLDLAKFDYIDLLKTH